jgi:hypothetical protein
LLPTPVVSWMEEHPPPLPKGQKGERLDMQRRLLRPLAPMPAPWDLPVILGARLSLSFPGLLSAVPLYSLDFGRIATGERSAWWDQWRLAHVEDWRERLEEERRRGEGAEHPLLAQRSWFSDGGISSNFPVHFFDGLLPRWPTFAINLRDFHPDHPQDPDDEGANIYLPTTNDRGIVDWTRTIRERRRPGSLIDFFGAILDTARTWHDNALLPMPGYRDRVVHVSHSKAEGGMNLNMPVAAIDALAERGRQAGERLRNNFTADPGSVKLSWDNHRWVRYRSSLASIEAGLASWERSFATPEGDAGTIGSRSYSSLVRRQDDEAPRSYKLETSLRRASALAYSEVLEELAAKHEEAGSGASFSATAPNPVARLRMVPPV